MNQKSKDETRWLVRFWGILIILLAIHNIVMQCHQLQADSGAKSISVFAFAVFLCWLGYKMIRCSSLWNIVLWASQYSITHLYFQSQYYRINQHIRSGFVGGIIVLAAQLFVPVLQLYYKGSWFCKSFRMIWTTTCWPLKQIGIFSDTRESPIFVFVVFAYFFIIGFVIGTTASFLKKKLSKSCHPV